MRRVLSALLILGCLVAAAPAASAATTDACRSLSSDFRPVRINLTWQPGQAFPGTNDEWWAQTVAGFQAEGLVTLEEAAALFETTPAGLYELIVTGIRGRDKNGNGIVCSKSRKEQQNGSPAYVFNAVDDQKK